MSTFTHRQEPLCIGATRNQPDQRNVSPGPPRVLAEIGVRGIDALGKSPESFPLALVLHGLGARWRTAEYDLRMLAEVVIPRWVPG
jgi:hypothetical protein